MKVFNIYLILIIAIISVYGFYIVPNFVEMYDSFTVDEPLPFSTKLVLSSYKYWGFIIILPLFVHFKYFHKVDGIDRSTVKNIGILLLSFALLFLIVHLIMISLYLPVFDLGKGT